MARFPDGTILMYKPDYKNVSVEVTTTELIKCKNCIYGSVRDVWLDDTATIKGCTICDITGAMKNPEGFCDMAHGKDDDDGR